MSRRGASSRILIWTLRASAAVGVVTAMRVTALYWYRTPELFLRIKSSIWVALAWDAAHGELYRPVISAAGYGGTRYMPLLFLAHAGLMRAGFDPIWSGVALMHVSVAIAAAVLFFALRALDVDRRLALPLAVLVWGTILFQQSATDLIPDYLAAALVLAAIAVAIRSHRTTDTVAAGALIVMAALTKITAIAFAVPIVIGLWTERRDGVLPFCLTTIVGFCIGVVAIEVVSGGNFHRSFFATAVAGTTWADVIGAVPQLVRELIEKPFDIGVPFVVACWCAYRRDTVWAAGYLVTAAVVVVVIFATPGTVSNHLVDAHLASLLTIGVALQRATLAPRVATAVFAANAVVLVAITIPVPGLPSVIENIHATGSRSRDIVRIIRQDVPSPGPWLCFDPLVPILSGERPWLLDFNNLEIAYAAHTPLGRDVAQRVGQEFFSAVVVPDGYRSDLMALVRATYVPTASDAGFTVFVSRQCLQQSRSPEHMSGLTGLPSGPNPRCVSTHQ